MHAYTLSIQDDCHTVLGQLRLYSKIPSQKQQQKTNTPKNQNQNNPDYTYCLYWVFVLPNFIPNVILIQDICTPLTWFLKYCLA